MKKEYFYIRDFFEDLQKYMDIWRQKWHFIIAIQIF